MQGRRFATISAIAVLGAAGTARADTLVCKSGRIVQPGMTTTEVISKCGAPTSKESWTEDIRATNPSGYRFKVGEAVIETWHYDRGTQKPAAVLVVRDGKVISIGFE